MQQQVHSSSSETLLPLLPHVPRKAHKTQVCVCCKLACVCVQINLPKPSSADLCLN